MAYAQLDDRWDDHRKIKRAWRRQPAAVALHAMAITYCNRHNNDGRLEAEWVEEKLALLPCRQSARAAVLTTLLDCLLFERIDVDTFLVHDYLDWNRSREKRAELAERGRKGGLARAQAAAKPRPEPPPSRGPSQGSSPTRHDTTAAEEQITSDAGGADTKATDEDRALCRLLAELALERNPKFKVKSKGRWLTDMRLLRDRDSNTAAEVDAALRWVFRDRFWSGVIQSPGNLREHFPKIWAQMHPTENVVPIRRHNTPDGNASDWLREDFIDGEPIADANVVSGEAL